MQSIPSKLLTVSIGHVLILHLLKESLSSFSFKPLGDKKVPHKK
jgi:hypothetical protein